MTPEEYNFNHINYHVQQRILEIVVNAFENLFENYNIFLTQSLQIANDRATILSSEIKTTKDEIMGVDKKLLQCAKNILFNTAAFKVEDFVYQINSSIAFYHELVYDEIVTITNHIIQSKIELDSISDDGLNRIIKLPQSQNNVDFKDLSQAIFFLAKISLLHHHEKELELDLKFYKSKDFREMSFNNFQKNINNLEQDIIQNSDITENHRRLNIDIRYACENELWGKLDKKLHIKRMFDLLFEYSSKHKLFADLLQDFIQLFFFSEIFNQNEINEILKPKSTKSISQNNNSVDIAESNLLINNTNQFDYSDKQKIKNEIIYKVRSNIYGHFLHPIQNLKSFLSNLTHTHTTKSAIQKIEELISSSSAKIEGYNQNLVKIAVNISSISFLQNSNSPIEEVHKHLNSFIAHIDNDLNICVDYILKEKPFEYSLELYILEEFLSSIKGFSYNFSFYGDLLATVFSVELLKKELIIWNNTKSFLYSKEYDKILINTVNQHIENVLNINDETIVENYCNQLIHIIEQVFADSKRSILNKKILIQNLYEILGRHRDNEFLHPIYKDIYKKILFSNLFTDKELNLFINLQPVIPHLSESEKNLMISNDNSDINSFLNDSEINPKYFSLLPKYLKLEQFKNNLLQKFKDQKHLDYLQFIEHSLHFYYYELSWMDFLKPHEVTIIKGLEARVSKGILDRIYNFVVNSNKTINEVRSILSKSGADETELEIMNFYYNHLELINTFERDEIIKFLENEFQKEIVSVINYGKLKPSADSKDSLVAHYEAITKIGAYTSSNTITEKLNENELMQWLSNGNALIVTTDLNETTFNSWETLRNKKLIEKNDEGDYILSDRGWNQIEETKIQKNKSLIETKENGIDKSELVEAFCSQLATFSTSKVKTKYLEFTEATINRFRKLKSHKKIQEFIFAETNKLSEDIVNYDDNLLNLILDFDFYNDINLWISVSEIKFNIDNYYFSKHSSDLLKIIELKGFKNIDELYNTTSFELKKIAVQHHSAIEESINKMIQYCLDNWKINYYNSINISEFLKQPIFNDDIEYVQFKSNFEYNIEKFTNNSYNENDITFLENIIFGLTNTKNFYRSKISYFKIVDYVFNRLEELSQSNDFINSTFNKYKYLYDEIIEQHEYVQYTKVISTNDIGDMENSPKDREFLDSYVLKLFHDLKITNENNRFILGPKQKCFFAGALDALILSDILPHNYYRNSVYFQNLIGLDYKHNPSVKLKGRKEYLRKANNWIEENPYNPFAKKSSDEG